MPHKHRTVCPFLAEYTSTLITDDCRNEEKLQTFISDEERPIAKFYEYLRRDARSGVKSNGQSVSLWRSSVVSRQFLATFQRY